MAQARKQSLIKKYISKELYVDLYKVTLLGAGFSNEDKGLKIFSLLNKYNIKWDQLGSGTNRLGVLIDGYVFKFSLDKDGMIDNRREFKYAKDLQPYVIKVYECIPNGLISVNEYISAFSKDEFLLPENKIKIKKILTEISEKYLIGDVGFSFKNFANWGTRNDGSICMLDFAYIYSISYQTFVCKCDGQTIMLYDENFVDLYCPRCGRKYTFGGIRKRISKKQQEEEIGDIRTLSYNLKEPVENVLVNPKFEEGSKVVKVDPTKPLTPKEKLKRYKKFIKSRRSK